jgi:hypothetical protein
VEESNLGDVQSHVFNLGIVRSFRESDLKEGIDGGVTNHPVEGL